MGSTYHEHWELWAFHEGSTFNHTGLFLTHEGMAAGTHAWVIEFDPQKTKSSDAAVRSTRDLDAVTCARRVATFAGHDPSHRLAAVHTGEYNVILNNCRDFVAKACTYAEQLGWRIDWDNVHRVLASAAAHNRDWVAAKAALLGLVSRHVGSIAHRTIELFADDMESRYYKPRPAPGRNASFLTRNVRKQENHALPVDGHRQFPLPYCGRHDPSSY